MTTRANNIESKTSGAPSVLLALAAILGIAGIAAWVYQVSQGMQVTSLNQQVVWGLYIAAFFTAVGSGAALLVLAGLSAFTPVLDTVARIQALVVALAAFFAGAVFIVMDVGNPLQVWRIITSFRFNSLMTWDFWLLLGAAIVTVAYLLVSRQGGTNKILGGLAIAAGIAVVAVEGWMLSTLAARALWSSGLTLVAFLVNASVAGLGLILWAVPQMRSLRRLLLAALALSSLVLLAEVLTGAVSGNPRTQQEISQLLSGPVSPLFWFHVVAGIVVPLLLLTVRRFQTLAACLAVVGVVAEKLWFLAAGQTEPHLPLETGSYMPSGLELVAVIGISALAILVFWVLRALVRGREAA